MLRRHRGGTNRQSLAFQPLTHLLQGFAAAQNILGGSINPLTVLRKAETLARSPNYKLRPQYIFQALNVHAHRRLSKMQLLCSPGKAAVFRRSRKAFQLANADVQHVPSSWYGFFL